MFGFWIFRFGFDLNWDIDLDRSLALWIFKYLWIDFDRFWGLKIKIWILWESKLSYMFLYWNIDDFGLKSCVAWLCLNPLWTGNVWQVSSISYCWINIEIEIVPLENEIFSRSVIRLSSLIFWTIGFIVVLERLKSFLLL